MMREGNQDTDLSLGELLKKKGSEGVRILMLLWDDRTSDNLLIREGVMTTHDEDMGSYFQDSGVHCVLCPRNPNKGQSLAQDMECVMMFTHHQKTVILEADDVPA
ncbi:hypothetical protein CDL15_Pgr015343 [Punica granatum]|uniref:Uncharacterized protein n=1 Tax=Punica granatum TaxID=22663 RepID=A0A218W0C4_PUNGR|nr:hypothetical protein CDL15_Pgr015343 [Punica granatum]PKI79573.1 hypothetical protein CRG98_000048 [Punica granatum]